MAALSTGGAKESAGESGNIIDAVRPLTYFAAGHTKHT